MPSVDDIGCALQVEYTPKRNASLPFGTLSTAVSGAEWRPHVRKTRGVVQPNEEMVARVEASVARGTAEFHVVCELQGKPEWCELQVDRRGARLRCLHGLSSLLALVGQGAISAASRLPISAASRLHLGRISAAHLGCTSARPQLNLGCQGDGRKSLAWRDADSSCASFYPPSPADAASVVLPSELLQVRVRVRVRVSGCRLGLLPAVSVTTMLRLLDSSHSPLPPVGSCSRHGPFLQQTRRVSSVAHTATRPSFLPSDAAPGAAAWQGRRRGGRASRQPLHARLDRARRAALRCRQPRHRGVRPPMT